MVCVFFGEIFDTKIVNVLGERGSSCSVALEAWSIWGGFISIWGEVANKLVEGDDSCLFEAIHAALYIKVYKIVGSDVVDPV